MNSKRILLLLLMLSFSIHASAQLAGVSFAQASASKKATLVCMYSETPGYITTTSGGTQGVLPEIMNSFAGYMKKNNGIDISYNYQPVKKNAPIQEIFESVTNAPDGVFGLVFIFFTEERKKTLNFSLPIFESPSFLLTSKSAPDIASRKEVTEKLKGYKAYVNQGNFYEDRFKELKSNSLPDLKIEYFKSYNVANVSETISKDKAMMYVDISGLLYAMEKKLPFKNHKVLQLATPSGIIQSRKNSWKEPFNKFLQSGFLESMEFRKILADNLGTRTLSLLKPQSEKE